MTLGACVKINLLNLKIPPLWGFFYFNSLHFPHQRPLPTVAPVATQQAKIAHKNIMKLIKGDTNLEKFAYTDMGAMAPIGRGQAV